jgi:hypothetical protein
MSVGVMKDQKLKLRNLHVSQTLVYYESRKKIVYYESRKHWLELFWNHIIYISVLFVFYFIMIQQSDI